MWACEGVSGSDDWIGLQVCVDNAEASDFMVGVAADNYHQVLVDGEIVVDATTYTGDWFYYWVGPRHRDRGGPAHCSGQEEAACL